MFETIGTLFTIAIWAIAIFLFGGGIFICIGNLISGDGWEKFWAVIALVLGAISFVFLYNWLESVVWCLILSGGVLGLGNAGSTTGSPNVESRTQKEPGIIETITDEYLEKKALEETIENAINKANRWK